MIFLREIFFLFFGFFFVVKGYLYLFDIHTFIHTIFSFVLWGGVSVGRCAFFVFGHRRVAC